MNKPMHKPMVRFGDGYIYEFNPHSQELRRTPVRPSGFERMPDGKQRVIRKFEENLRPVLGELAYERIVNALLRLEEVQREMVNENGRKQAEVKPIPETPIFLKEVNKIK